MIFRAEKNKNYTTMSNVHLHDKRLSLKAKGLLSMCLSFTDEWDFSMKGLISVSKENKTAIMSALKELKENGYLKITEGRDASGKFDYIYTIYENPQGCDLPCIEKPYTENRYTEKPYTEEPYTENVPEINTNKTNTNKTNTKETNTNKYKALGEIADDKLRDTLTDFINHRKALKRPLTENALNLILKKLDKMANDNDTKIAILEQSIENGWIGIFELKGNKNKKAEELDDFYKMAQAFGKGDI